MKRSFRSLMQWRSDSSPARFLVLSLFFLAPILAACSPSNADELAEGDLAPSFSLPSASGDHVALSSYRDSKPVLLYFHMAYG